MAPAGHCQLETRAVVAKSCILGEVRDLGYRVKSPNLSALMKNANGKQKQSALGAKSSHMLDACWKGPCMTSEHVVATAPVPPFLGTAQTR